MLAQPWSGGMGAVPLAKAELQELKKSKTGVLQVLPLEEKMDMVLQSFLEPERDLLECGSMSLL